MATGEPKAKLIALLTDATSRLDSDDRELVLQQADWLLAEGMVTASRLQAASVEDLKGSGLALVAAVALKMAFPAQPAASVAGAGVSGGMAAGGMDAAGMGVGGAGTSRAISGGRLFDAFPDWKAEILSVVREAVQQATMAKVISCGFSDVGSRDAEQMLDNLNLIEVLGNDLEPIEVPATAPVCDAFDYSSYPSENAGTPDFLVYHREQLLKFGVKFGRGGFSIYDLHSSGALYKFNTHHANFSGNVDGCLAPFGLAITSAAREVRVGYEHKQTEAQRDAYYTKHPELGRSSKVSAAQDEGGIAFRGGNKGQTVTALIGACVYNQFPLILDLTDGTVHHVLQLRGEELWEWLSLTPQQAYFYQAQMLTEQLGLLSKRKLDLEDIPEEMQGPMRKLHALREGSALREQLDAVVPWDSCPEDRLQSAFHIISAWQGSCAGEMPVAVKAMFG